MAHSTPEHNPFMLLVHPEAVLAAVEKSERLGQLNRHLCRPLDRPFRFATYGRSPARDRETLLFGTIPRPAH